jgi:C-terminal processing protease CtpA/Prc
LLGDHHSSYISPPNYGVTIRDSTVTCTASMAPQPDVPSDVGYVRVTAFSGSGTGATAYANTLHSRIRAEDTADDVVGWIVDLRGNTGGNMWPMIAGIGPILGEGTVGWFINPDQVETRWEYRGGLSIVAGTTVTAVTSPYTLRNVDPKVAVLTDGRVASSGEAVAIAFRGRADTRFFGTPTCGLSTANATFEIDGAQLSLTVASLADRNKTTYGDSLPPDELITDDAALIQQAIAWIRGS